jgi:hypothetical protein
MFHRETLYANNALKVGVKYLEKYKLMKKDFAAAIKSVAIEYLHTE